MTRVNLTVDRVLAMDEREMYNLVDAYVKGRLSRFAIDPSDQAALEQREIPKSERDIPLSETAELFDDVKSQIHEILYSKAILPRHRFALMTMTRSVQSQLDEIDDNPQWKRSAQSFLDLVKDELARAEIVLGEYVEQSAQRHIAVLLEAIQQHRNADDLDDADDNLYAVADTVAAEFSALVGA